jgi:sulfur carrier protein
MARLIICLILNNNYMNVKINGELTKIAEHTTVADIATANDVGQSGAAIAVNDKLVRRADWQTKELVDGDDVIIIKAAYGG